MTPHSGGKAGQGEGGQGLQLLGMQPPPQLLTARREWDRVAGPSWQPGRGEGRVAQKVGRWVGEWHKGQAGGWVSGTGAGRWAGEWHKGRADRWVSGTKGRQVSDLHKGQAGGCGTKGRQAGWWVGGTKGRQVG